MAVKGTVGDDKWREVWEIGDVGTQKYAGGVKYGSDGSISYTKDKVKQRGNKAIYNDATPSYGGKMQTSKARSTANSQERKTSRQMQRAASKAR